MAFLPLLAMAAIAFAAYLSPEMLRWLMARIACRIAYIEAGRDAAATEMRRLEAA